MIPFAPTHLICWTPAGGQEQTCEVMVGPGPGAPTEVEHRFGLTPHWRYVPTFTTIGTFVSAEWLCDGRRAPGGRRGTVEVLPLPPCDGTIREAAEFSARLWRDLHYGELVLPVPAWVATQWEVACEVHAPLSDLPPDESRAGLAVFSAEVRGLLEGA